MTDVTVQIRQLLDPILRSLELTLWDMEFQKHGPKWLLRIYIDRETTDVTLNDCEAVSRDLSATLDVEDIIPHAYTLEVSSPGLDRTLTKPEHFFRFSGRAIKIKTYEQINGQKVFHGKLIGFDKDVVRMELGTGTIMEIPLRGIAKASLEVDF
ncbi:MAG TPA: ribosome maturation factor RimP [Nitrospirota bacterium]|nr:ribosome maturation factor RimP [Nitrospirota bacterium]